MADEDWKSFAQCANQFKGQCISLILASEIANYWKLCRRSSGKTWEEFSDSKQGITAIYIIQVIAIDNQFENEHFTIVFACYYVLDITCESPHQ